MSTNTPGRGQPRPRWTLAEASRRTGVSRATLLRKIESGLLPGAEKTDRGWSIGIDDLLVAGLHPDRPSPPADMPRMSTDMPTDMSAPVHERVHAAQRIAELERDLAVAHAQRAAAEQIAAERERIIQAQALALRMLEAGPPVTANPDAEASPTALEPSAQPLTPFGWVRRVFIGS